MNKNKSINTYVHVCLCMCMKKNIYIYICHGVDLLHGRQAHHRQQLQHLPGVSGFGWGPCFKEYGGFQWLFAVTTLPYSLP